MECMWLGIAVEDRMGKRLASIAKELIPAGIMRAGTPARE
jgi:hypothetical protein